MTAQPGRMDPEEFRSIGHELVDWVANYLANVENLPVMSDVSPGDVYRRLPQTAPEKPEAWSDIIADLDEVIVPALTHWQSPNFFAYFPANNSGPSILGELVAAGLGVQGMLWATSPAATEVETLVLDWMAAELRLPTAFHSSGTGGGVIQDSASSAALVSIIASRQQARNRGISSDRHALFVSQGAHSSLTKGVRVAGYLDHQLRLVATDDAGRMVVDELERAITQAQSEGLTPTFVSATIGTTATGAVDPVADIGRIRDRLAMWLHVDAAYAGVAAICPEFSTYFSGLEFADSYCTNAHKWLLTNFDCSMMWVRNRADLIDALSISPSYLKNAASDSGAVIDYRDWMVPLGRRFRALKLWFVIRSFGMDGLRKHIRHHVELTSWLAARVDAHDDLEIVGEPMLGLVCFKHRSGDAATSRIAELVQADRTVMLTTAVHDDATIIRVSIGSPQTEARHVAALWERFARAMTER